MHPSLLFQKYAQNIPQTSTGRFHSLPGISLCGSIIYPHGVYCNPKMQKREILRHFYNKFNVLLTWVAGEDKCFVNLEDWEMNFDAEVFRMILGVNTGSS